VGTEVELRFAMELALGLPEAQSSYFSTRESAGNGWFPRRCRPPGRSISGLDKLMDLPGIDQISINRNAGEAVDWRRGLQDTSFKRTVRPAIMTRS